MEEFMKVWSEIVDYVDPRIEEATQRLKKNIESAPQEDNVQTDNREIKRLRILRKELEEENKKLEDRIEVINEIKELEKEEKSRTQGKT